jgi:hypothetical protein
MVEIMKYEEICAAMVQAVDPDLRLNGAELKSMAISIARRFAEDQGVDDASSTILKMDRVALMLYAQAGKPYGSSPEARWRWFFEQDEDGDPSP